MTADELRKLISSIRLWKKGDTRAPHKPLLILHSLGRIQKGQPRLASYVAQRDALENLLVEFGPAKKSTMRYPFVFLSNDGIWELKGKKPIDSRRGYSDREFTELDIVGGFTSTVQKVLRESPDLLGEIASQILYAYFPTSVHEDILSMVGLDLSAANNTAFIANQSARDHRFRERVLQAYEYSCAVCQFGIRLGNTPVALEAAHIRWHQYQGPDIEENGVALCSIHHRLFDRGVFTLNDDLHIQVAQAANGPGLQKWLMDYHGKPLNPPVSRAYKPREEFVQWHVSEVFRSQLPRP